jgi:hypothetical protein
MYSICMVYTTEMSLGTPQKGLIPTTLFQIHNSADSLVGPPVYCQQDLGSLTGHVQAGRESTVSRENTSWVLSRQSTHQTFLKLQHAFLSRVRHFIRNRLQIMINYYMTVILMETCFHVQGVRSACLNWKIQGDQKVSVHRTHVL